MRAFVLDADGTVRRTSSVDDVIAAYRQGLIFWADLEERTPAADAFLADVLKLHSLVVEDIWSDRALPKIEDFDDYLYVLVHGLKANSNPCAVELLELDIVFCPRFVVTYHPASRAAQHVADELQRSPRLLKKGTVWVVHALLDHLVDLYLPILEELQIRVEELEDDAVARAGTPLGPEVMQRIFAYKRSLQKVRRIGLQQRDILLRLSRAEFDEIPRETLPFFRDVYDHFARVTDLAEANRELVVNAFDAFMSVQGNRMNEVMKALTLMSTVMLPITFIAGVYGMNFESMPEFHWRYGHAFALALMAAVAVVIIVIFRRKKWL